jgi:hypothetical protein
MLLLFAKRASTRGLWFKSNRGSDTTSLTHLHAISTLNLRVDSQQTHTCSVKNAIRDTLPVVGVVKYPAVQEHAVMTMEMT